MHRAKGVFRRGIDRIQFQRDIPGIGQVVPFACRDDDDIIIVDVSLEIQVVPLIPHLRPGLLNPDELVNIGLFQYLPDIEAHQGKLQVICP